MVNNLMLLRSMTRLSSMVRDLKSARRILNPVLASTEYFIVNGETSDTINSKIKDSVNNCLYVENYLLPAIAAACKRLNGFDPNTMDPVSYISTSDTKSKSIDIMRGQRIVANISLITGEIVLIDPENPAEEKCPAEKS